MCIRTIVSKLLPNVHYTAGTIIVCHNYKPFYPSSYMKIREDGHLEFRTVPPLSPFTFDKPQTFHISFKNSFFPVKSLVMNSQGMFRLLSTDEQEMFLSSSWATSNPEFGSFMLDGSLGGFNKDGKQVCKAEFRFLALSNLG